MDALAHRHLRQADENRFGQTHGNIDLGNYRDSIDPHQRERIQLGQHGALLALE
jgi:hypothetical protein